MYNINSWFVIKLHQNLAELMASFEDYGDALGYTHNEPLDHSYNYYLIDVDRKIHSTKINDADHGLDTTWLGLIPGSTETECPRNCYDGCEFCGEIGQFVGPRLDEVLRYAQCREAWWEIDDMLTELEPTLSVTIGYEEMTPEQIEACLEEYGPF